MHAASSSAFGTTVWQSASCGFARQSERSLDPDFTVLLNYSLTRGGAVLPPYLRRIMAPSVAHAAFSLTVASGFPHILILVGGRGTLSILSVVSGALHNPSPR